MKLILLVSRQVWVSCLQVFEQISVARQGKDVTFLFPQAGNSLTFPCPRFIRLGFWVPSCLSNILFCAAVLLIATSVAGFNTYIFEFTQEHRTQEPS